jgi:hypothetical protein
MSCGYREIWVDAHLTNLVNINIASQMKLRL